ncbi:MAG TPA: tetratricopeptide repeat protein, partial [Desulfocapsa sulfexigens]|nr:tetratricopeptide repeat protein [Desulfocapsa sulfexigens]
MPVNKKKDPIGLYRRDLTDPARLCATTIGRQHLLNDLLEKLERRRKKKSGQNHLFIGPRGIGKTHLLTLLEQGINTNATLKNSYTIIRFPEESNRVLSFADLLLGLIDLLAEVEEDSDFRKLHNKLEIEDQDTVIIDYILPRLKHYHKQSGKILLIMMENLDVLFTQQLKKKQDIHRLRSLLMDNSHIMLIGTAPIFFPALNDVKHPLYDFFDIQIVEELGQEETLALIKVHLQWDKRDDLLQQFEQLKPRILAMHTLTGGNPRLLTMLYELIAEEDLSDIKARFHQMLDRITPFYQERIKDLPPQERALLETIALMRTGQRTPVNIARKFRKPRHQTSVLLKRMTDAGYLSVSPHPTDKRSRLYRIKEGFFDIWLAMNESRAQRKHLPYLVEFFALWYADVQTRELKRQQLREKLERLSDVARKNELDMLGYLSEASDEGSEKQQTKMELAIRQLKLGSREEAKVLLKESEKLLIEKPGGLLVWMHDKVDQWADGMQSVDLIGRMEKIVEYWQQQRSGDLEQAARLFHTLRLDFSSHGLHQLHIALLQDRLQEIDKPEQETELLLQIANSQYTDGQLSNALTTLNHVLGIAKVIENRKLEGTTLNNISQIYHSRGDYETALKYLQESLAIRQEIGDKSGEGTTLNNISQIFKARGDYETALKYLQQSLAIQQEIGDKSGEGTTLNNISQIYDSRGDYETALKYLQQSLAIRQEIGDKS